MSYDIQDNRESYPTPDNTQPLTNNSPKSPSTFQSTQSNTTQIADSFLSDVPQGAYSEYSTQDSSSVFPSIDLAPHTPESLFCSPTSLGDERTDLNSRKNREQSSILRRSPKISSNQTPQASELQSDSTSLRSQDSSNNQQEKNTRDLISTSNMILDSVNLGSVSLQDQESDDEMRDIEYIHERQQTGTTGTLDNDPESIHLNEIGGTLLRQSEHYNNMASKISNLKFIKVQQPESEEEIEQFTFPITPGIRRSTRKRTPANYSYPRYSYGGGRRSRTRKRNRSYRKRNLSVTENEASVDSDVVNNERSEDTDEPVHNLSPVQSDEEQEANEDSHDIQGADDNGNIDENIFDNELQSNLYLKHDLRSRKIMLEFPEEVAESEETEKEPVVAKKITRSKQPAKKPILKTTSKKSAKTIPKRRTSRRSTSRKKNEDREWHPDEADNELGDDSETVMSTPRDRRNRHAISKTNSSSKAYTTPKKTRVNKNVESTDVIPEVSNTKRLSSKKATPKITKTPKTTRKGKKPAQSSRGREKGRSRITRHNKSKNHDTEYIYSGEEETESEVEIIETVDVVNDDSANQILRELSDAETDNVIQDEIEQNVDNIEEPVSTPARPKRTRKSIKSSLLTNTPKSSRSTRSRHNNKRGVGKDANMQVEDDALSNIRDPSDNETVNMSEVQVDATQPKKMTRSIRGRGRGGKTKGRGGRVNGNTTTDQPIVPTPGIVELSSENPTTFTNAVRALKEKNFDLVDSSENTASIEEIRSPRSHNLATYSASLSSAPPESQTTQTHPSSDWSKDQWSSLKVIYDEYPRSDKGSEDVYREVTKKFYEVDISNKRFEGAEMRNRIIALEIADSEKSSEPSNGTQRRGSIESSSSKGSRSSVSRYNKAYSNLRNGTKRKRSKSNATSIQEGNNNDETEDKASKRHRAEGNTPSGSGITRDTNVSQTFPTPNNNVSSPDNSVSSPISSPNNGVSPPDNSVSSPNNSVPPPNNSVLSRLFGGWFRS